jgi:CheY-like chemotaxis protein
MEVNRTILETLAYHVLKAKTGMEAITLAQTFDGDIDLAILDIGLPDMGGEKVYRHLIEARPNLKVIVCSGYPIDGPAQQILDAGARGFIQKPYALATLSAKLKEVLTRAT